MGTQPNFVNGSINFLAPIAGAVGGYYLVDFLTEGTGDNLMALGGGLLGAGLGAALLTPTASITDLNSYPRKSQFYGRLAKGAGTMIFGTVGSFVTGLGIATIGDLVTGDILESPAYILPALIGGSLLSYGTANLIIDRRLRAEYNTTFGQ